MGGYDFSGARDLDEMTMPDSKFVFDLANQTFSFHGFELGPDFIVIPKDGHILGQHPSSGSLRFYCGASPAFAVNFQDAMSTFMPKPDTNTPPRWRTEGTISLRKTVRYGLFIPAPNP